MGNAGKLAIALVVACAAFGLYAGAEALKQRQRERVASNEAAAARIAQMIADDEARRADMAKCLLWHQPLLPSRAAAHELMLAKSNGASAQDLTAIMLAHRTEMPEEGSRCVVLDIEGDWSHIRITSGALAGRDGWVMSEWRRKPAPTATP